MTARFCRQFVRRLKAGSPAGQGRDRQTQALAIDKSHVVISVHIAAGNVGGSRLNDWTGLPTSSAPRGKIAEVMATPAAGIRHSLDEYFSDRTGPGLTPRRAAPDLSTVTLSRLNLNNRRP